MIQIEDLRVDYGPFTAVDGLSLEVPEGSIFGLVGPNGAGKTSTIKVLATLMEPTYGVVRIDGKDVERSPEEVRAVLGYMPDLAPIIGDLTVLEWLDHFARCYGLRDPGQRKKRVRECLERVDLLESGNRFCKTLSRGMTQRVVLAKTLLHCPKVLLLDEPASGMDPIARLDLSDMLKELGRSGTTVLISSHILSELSEMCTDVAFLDKGKLRLSGGISKILKQITGEGSRVRIGVLEGLESARSLLQEDGGVSSLSMDGDEIRCVIAGGEQERAELLGRIARVASIHRFEVKEAGLGDLLREVDK